MIKIVTVLLSLAFLFGVGLASCPFDARFDVHWDTSVSRWIVNDELMPDIEVIGNKLILFNVTESGGNSFFISFRHGCNDTKTVLSRKNNVTNNACTPPCSVSFKLPTEQYSYCSPIFRGYTAGYLQVIDCEGLSETHCATVIGCGWHDKKCQPCTDASSEKDCEKLDHCSWCPGDEVCLHEKSNACRDQIERDRPVPGWVWLLITLVALFLLIVIFLILFLTERRFQSRWAAMSKMDKDFAEVGRGANDGLSATD